MSVLFKAVRRVRGSSVPLTLSAPPGSWDTTQTIRSTFGSTRNVELVVLGELYKLQRVKVEHR
jgi:hypothetical protein